MLFNVYFYFQVGLKQSNEFIIKLDSFLTDNTIKRQKMSQNKKKIHIYKPEDYGLNSVMIKEEFKDYIHKYL